MLDLLKKTFFVVYAITKDFLPSRLNNCNNEKMILIRKLILTLFTIFCVCILIIFILPFALFRTFLVCCLKFNYGEKFGGLLKGYDSMFENGLNMSMIMLLSCPDESTLAFEKLKMRIEITYKSCSKFSSCIKSIFGYYYYVKDQVRFDECVEYVNHKCVTINELLKYIEQNYFYIKQTHTWRVFLVPIESNLYVEKNTQIALIFLFRHSIGDGCFIAGILNTHLFDHPETVRLNISKTMPNLNFNNINLIANPFTMKDDGNKLKIEGNDNLHVAVFMEDELNYISVIKKVQKYLGVSFGAVVMAITWAATCRYFNQRRIQFSNLIVVQTIRDTMKDVSDIISGIFDCNKLSNEFGIVGLSIPVTPEKQSIKSTVLYVNRYLERMRCSVDGFMSYVATRFLFHYLPARLSVLMYTTFLPSATIGITNMAVEPKRSIAGYEVDHKLGFVTEVAHSVFRFFINTYDNKLHLVITSNRGYVNNSEELQDILMNVLNSIDALKEEVAAEDALKSDSGN